MLSLLVVQLYSGAFYCCVHERGRIYEDKMIWQPLYQHPPTVLKAMGEDRPQGAWMRFRERGKKTTQTQVEHVWQTICPHTLVGPATLYFYRRCRSNSDSFRVMSTLEVLVLCMCCCDSGCLWSWRVPGTRALLSSPLQAPNCSSIGAMATQMGAW